MRSLPVLLSLLVACAEPPPAASRGDLAALALVGPMLPGSTALVTSGQSYAEFGYAVSTAGDVNGDGYADVLVGARYHDNVETSEGRAYLYLGSASGLQTTPAWTTEPDQTGASLGETLAGAGDVNGDGYDDVIVGRPEWDNGNGNEGGAQLFLGSPTGLAATAAWAIEPDVNSANLGSGVAGAGDVNGDGYDDVIVGAEGITNGQSGEGRAYVYLGSPAGLSATAAWTAESDVASASFGADVAGAGDVNGDGFDDVIVGADDYANGQAREGRAYVYLGSATGLQATPTWTAESNVSSAYFGADVASAGDVNGDGFDDIVVGARYWSDGVYREGGAFVYLGSPTGPSATAAWSLTSNVDSAQFGFAVGSAGDVDGDGRDDLIVGAPDYSGGSFQEGAVFLYRGTPTGLETTPAWWLDSDLADANFGSAVGPAGDVDGDGDVDVLVGAYDLTLTMLEEGGAYVFDLAALFPDTDGDGLYDGADGCPTVADPAHLDDDGDGVGNACDEPWLAVEGVVSLGARVTLAASGAAPGELVYFAIAGGSGQFGPCPLALGGACMDLGANALLLGTAPADATGTARKVVNVPPTLQANGVYTAQVAIRRGAGGSSSVTSPPLVVDGTTMDYDADGLTDAEETGLGTNPRLADSDRDGVGDGIEAADRFLDPLDPDTDGDGVSDGADLCTSGWDALDLDLDGVPDGCDNCPSDGNLAQGDVDTDGIGDTCEGPVLGAPRTAESDQVDARLGEGVAGVGDVNGDGYDDVVAGAPRWDGPESSEGVAYLYLGGAGGLSMAPSWTFDPDQSGAGIGGAVAPAGDVNGDGFADVVIGATGYDDGHADEGGAFVFLGSGAGLGATPQAILQPNRAYSSFGDAVAGAGDVNGDGYDDVVVGAYFSSQAMSGAGAAYVFHGSPTGVSTTPAWTVLGTQASEWFGRSVAGVGDVNGDGYDDVVIGADGHDDGQQDEGKAFLYLGSPTGLSATPAWTATGDQVNAWFGAVSAAAGDVNGDGYADVAFSTSNWDGAVTNGGAVWVYLGSPLGLADTADWTTLGLVEMGFGMAMNGAGDVDGDGYDDLVVAAQFYDHEFLNEGAVYVFLGSPEGMSLAAATQVESDYPNSGFGAWVAAAGDVNDDGRGDVVVGCPTYAAGQTGEGRIFVYEGQAP